MKEFLERLHKLMGEDLEFDDKRSMLIITSEKDGEKMSIMSAVTGSGEAIVISLQQFLNDNEIIKAELIGRIMADMLKDHLLEGTGVVEHTPFGKTN